MPKRISEVQRITQWFSHAEPKEAKVLLDVVTSIVKDKLPPEVKKKAKKEEPKTQAA
jgi:hypothetical protein